MEQLETFVALRERRPRLFYLSVLTLAVLIIYPIGNVLLELAGVTSGPRLRDFAAYYHAALRFRLGYPLYVESSTIPELASLHGAEMDYLYPPAVVLLFLPFTVFPVLIAGILWNIVTLGVLWAAVYALLREYDVTLSRAEWALVVVCVTGFAPTVTRLKSGQISGLLAALLCFAAVIFERERSIDGARKLAGGCLVALAAVPKPFYAPAGAPLLRDFRRLLGSLVAIFIVTALGVVVFGPAVQYEYVEVLLQGKGWGSQQAAPGSWNASTFSPFYILGPWALVAKVLVLITAIVGVLYSRRSANARTDRYVFALGLLLVPIVNPTASVQNLNALIPAFLILLIVEVRRPDGRPAFVVGAILAVHVHPYTIEFLAKFGPRFIAELRVFEPLIPWLQPAAWGVFTTLLLVSYRIVKEAM